MLKLRKSRPNFFVIMKRHRRKHPKPKISEGLHDSRLSVRRIAGETSTFNFRLYYQSPSYSKGIRQAGVTIDTGVYSTAKKEG